MVESIIKYLIKTYYQQDGGEWQRPKQKRTTYQHSGLNISVQGPCFTWKDMIKGVQWNLKEKQVIWNQDYTIVDYS